MKHADILIWYARKELSVQVKHLDFLIRYARKDGVTGIICVYLSIFLHKNISCDPSLELSHRDSSNEGSQDMFIEK